jgi:hypothetical protein
MWRFRTIFLQRERCSACKFLANIQVLAKSSMFASCPRAQIGLRLSSLRRRKLRAIRRHIVPQLLKPFGNSARPARAHAWG